MSHITVTMNTVCTTILKNSLKELSFVLKVPILHLYSNNKFSKFQQKSRCFKRRMLATYPHESPCQKKKKSNPEILEAGRGKKGIVKLHESREQTLENLGSEENNVF